MLNKTPFIMRLGTSTEAILLKTGLGWQSELIHDTGANLLWLCPTTEGAFQPVQTLNMAVCNDGDVVVSGNEIVWSI